MKAEKDPKTGKWLIQYRYKDWTGKNRKSTKCGFKTKREAEEWYREFLMKQSQSCDMKFRDFMVLYVEDMKHRLCEHTMINKQYVIQDKLLPFFGEKRMNEITAADIRTWQNQLIQKGYKPTYLKGINNQELICKGWFLPPNTYDCGSFAVNGTAVIGKKLNHLNNG